MRQGSRRPALSQRTHRAASLPCQSPGRGAMTKLPRRKFLQRAAGAAAFPALSRIARAQAYPSRPIRIVVPLAAGGVADIAGRALAQQIGEDGKTAVVENRTGGGGVIGADFVAKAAPDGYTVYVGFHATQTVLPHLQRLPYDPENDF